MCVVFDNSRVESNYNNVTINHAQCIETRLYTYNIIFVLNPNPIFVVHPINGVSIEICFYNDLLSYVVM